MTKGTATQLQGRRRIIERPRLTRLLDESHARIKLLVAPAGYGKSTLARQWTAERPRAWYRIPAAAADVASVSRSIATAAADVLPGCSARLEERLRITKNPDAEFATLAEMLIEDLQEWPREAWLVLDDAQHALAREPTSRFVSMVVRESTVNALLCTRQRPPWITARDLLYGQALEIGRNSLAMTHDEAAAVMPDNAATPGVVALADGWPAVVGLASLTPEPALMSGMTAGLPEALYDYLAEELYQALPPESQDGMCLIAAAGVRSRRLIELLFPARDPERVLREVVDAGWLTSDTDGNLELHPLLEAFLRQKLEEEPTPDTRAKAERIADILIAEEHWDETFQVIERYALDDLLAHGRTGALEGWIGYAERRSISGPELDLTSAELLFREGRFHESEVRALAAADALGRGDMWASRSYARAGRAAHAANRETEAYDFYRLARVCANSDSERRTAVQGELAAAIDLELPDAPELFAQSAPKADDVDAVVDHVMRAMVLSSRFAIQTDLQEAKRAYSLLKLIADPVARCSFRNMYGYVLASAGEVEAATRVVAAQLDEAHRFRLDFVVPYAHLIEAMAEMVRGRFERVTDLIDVVEAAGRAAGDEMLTTSAAALRARCLTSQGQFESATNVSRRAIGAVPMSTRGELIATRALALACNRENERALAAVDAATSITGGVEARVMSDAARAIVAGNRADADMFTLASEALRSAIAFNCIECFIAGYRGSPQLVDVLLESDGTREDAAWILAIAGDSELFTQRSNPRDGTWEALSRREREVLALVADGLSNREIGGALFIAEATVKVHLSHIFEKLGVSSRTAAALRVPHHVRVKPRPAHEREAPEHP